MQQVRNLYLIRQEQGLTMSELAEKLRAYDPKAVGRTMLVEFENCRQPTTQRTLQALASVLGVGVDDLLRIVEVPGKPRPRRREPAVASL